jgi:hypothetical protein
VTFAELASGDDLGLEIVVVAEEQMFADADLPSGADQTFPIVGILAQLACEENLDAPPKKVARGGILGAEGLRLNTPAPPIEAGGKDSRVVEDNEISRAEHLGEFPEGAVFESPAAG